MQNFKINSNIKAAEGYFKLVIGAPVIAKSARPGQFVMVKVSDGCEPLLRRPLGIHSVKDSKVEILYEVVGKGTQILSQKKPGEFLDIIGPLGNGFNYRVEGSPPATGQAGCSVEILVAGGMGVAPLLFLAERLAYSLERIAYSKDKRLSAKRYPLNAIFLIGATTKSQIVCADEFKQLGCEVKVATDDGSRGFKGKVTDLLRNKLSAKRYPLSAIYACGPHPMLKEVAVISQKYNIPAQVSLESHMACGIGACLGCVVNTKEGYKRVCKEGPVFNADEIIW